VGLRRIESFLARAGDVEAGELPEAFAAAMDDDLGTPAAVAVIYDMVREGNKAADPKPYAAQVVAMLDLLGLNPADPAWGSSGGDDQRLTDAVDVLIAGLLEQRAQARADKDFAAADAIREQILAAGIEVEDTPDGPKWSLS
jgi:cysteinyl-tRNA synthetase